MVNLDLKNDKKIIILMEIHFHDSGRYARLSSMAILPVIKNRSTSKKFISREVDSSIINNIIEAGRLAPSAKNRQPWRFIVVSSPEVKSRVLKACYGAEAIESADKIIAVCTTSIEYKMPNGQLSYPGDLTFATSFMVLQAEYEGLGSCVVTTYDEEALRDLFTVPYSMRVFNLIALGYKGEENKIKERKSHSSVFNYEHW